MNSGEVIEEPVAVSLKQCLLEKAIKEALSAVDDITREGLQDTPRRWAKMFLELTGGHEFSMTTFKNERTDQMVVEVGIPFYSLCEHHLAPFFGTAVVAYIPRDRIVGISKLARTVEHFSRRLQVQERMTQQIADMLEEKLNPAGVAVMLRARHMCQEMRGIRKVGVETVTSCLKGAFLKEPEARAEFLNIARESK
jgi:GTP cyclohydrolase I